MAAFAGLPNSGRSASFGLMPSAQAMLMLKPNPAAAMNAHAKPENFMNLPISVI